MTDSSESDSSGCESSEAEKKDEPMSMDEGCCICEISDASNLDPLVYCDACNLAVHKLCYGIVSIPEGDWFCNVCKYWKKKRSKDPLCDPKSCPLKCVLCDQDSGAMKELHKAKKDEPDRWAHMVCALFIEEITFLDPDTSTGIIIANIDPNKKVGSGRKCHFCSNGGYVCRCSCDEQCGKWFHVTCAQRKQLLLMTDNSALAIESDRSSEFHVFCSTEKREQMKERKQKESEKQKERRKEKVQEEDERRRIKSKDKPYSDPAKTEKIAKLKRLQKAQSKLMLKSPGNPADGKQKNARDGEHSGGKPASKRAKQSGLAMEKTWKRAEKRKSNDESIEKDRKRSKMPKEPKKEVNEKELSIESDRNRIMGLFEKFDNEATSTALEMPYIRFQQFIEFLKSDSIYASLISPMNQLWAIHQKERQLSYKLATLRNTRELMEQQIEFQNKFIECVVENPENGYHHQNGYHTDSEAELVNGSSDFKSEVNDGDNVSTESATSSAYANAKRPVWTAESDDKN